MTTVKNILIILLGLTFVACHNKMTDNKTLSTSYDSIKTDSSGSNNSSVDNIQEQSTKKATEIVVKNKSDYSEKFIQGLKELGYERFDLIDSLLIINSKDTVTFSQTPFSVAYKKIVCRSFFQLRA